MTLSPTSSRGSSGGSSSLPDWWTVVDTPGSESVTFAGALAVNPATLGNVIEITGDGRFRVHGKAVDGSGTSVELYAAKIPGVGSQVYIAADTDSWAYHSVQVTGTEGTDRKGIVQIGTYGIDSVGLGYELNGSTFRFLNDALASICISGDATNKIAFFGTAPVAKPTGVAVSAAGIHAALVTLGLIAA